jgi:hypothetical protein
MMRMDVHIERLVLDGLALDAQGADALRGALEANLAEIFFGAALDDRRAAQGTPSRDAVAPRAAADAAALGREAALAIHRIVAR